MLRALLLKNGVSAPAAGVRVFFCGGTTGTRQSTVDSYAIASGAVAVEASLPATQSDGTAGGNATVGVSTSGYIGGSISAGLYRYTHVASSWASGSALSQARVWTASAGNGDKMLVWAGTTTGAAGGAVITGDEHVFASDTTVTGGSISIARTGMAGCGTTTTGYFGGGQSASGTRTTQVRRYDYATSTNISSGTSLGSTRKFLAATSNTAVGLFAAGDTTSGNSVSVDKYTFATEARVAGTALAGGKAGLAGAGDATMAVFGGGVGGSQSATVDTYVYNTDARTAGTSITQARSYLSAFSSTPGHL